MAAVPSVEVGVDAPSDKRNAHDAHDAYVLPASTNDQLTPPHSEDLDKQDASSELSELDMEELKAEGDDEDIGDVEPAYYYDGGKIPVFEPTMEQFRSFPKFIEKVDKYGMKSGIVKVVPPKEWRDTLQELDEAVKSIRVKNPIIQEFVGQNGNFGAYTQQNIEKQRSYNLPQWKAVTQDNQAPPRRGDRRKNIAPPKPKSTRPATTPLASGEKRKPGRPRRQSRKDESKDEENETNGPHVPPTPTSPEGQTADMEEENPELVAERPAKSKGKSSRPRGRRSSPKPRGRQPKATTVAERRKYNTTDVADDINEEDFEGFDYRFPEAKDFDKERCKELEEVYWKTVTYGTPMYGADMPGSLFADDTEGWHVGRLENLLDVLGTKVPGVNTTYLYLGMWKATFAWHLEDVDLYSINYIHFGAPKQWYSISQEDARRFEKAMKQMWPMDAKHCDQFLRHKTYLISPDKLMKDYGIKVNKLVHNEGEFVITYPYGYHSGYNLGYNCAESVNFATESWLNYGRIAKKCNCEADSVWVDVGEIERKLRGEPTPEWIEETDDEDEEEQLPTPPASVAGKRGRASNKGKKKGAAAKAMQPKEKKKIRRIAIKRVVKIPCALCPNEVPYDKLLPTDNGLMAHRMCAMYTPETYISEVDGKEMIHNVTNIDKSRLDLKCIYCRSKKGACFQCSEKKCTRAYHATCALAAGMLIDEGKMPTWDEGGTEFWYYGYDFRCRFHRPRRPKHWSLEHVERLTLPISYGESLRTGDIVQAQYFGAEVFGGTVVENRPGEQTVVVDVQPDGDRVEVEWKWLMVLDPAESKRPKPSPDAKRLPEKEITHNNDAFNASNRKDGVPDMGDVFVAMNEGADCKWAEWSSVNYLECRNPTRLRVDITDKPDQLWHYLGKTSTEAKAQYTHHPATTIHNPRSNFLDLVQPPAKPPAVPDRRSLTASYPGANYHANNAAMVAQRQQAQTPQQLRMAKPYQYKPKEILAKPQPPRLAMDVKAVMNQSPMSPHVPQNHTDNRGPTNGFLPNAYGVDSPSAASAHQHPAPQAYQQPPTPQTIAKDPLRAGYPYQSATYTQIHGSRSPREVQRWLHHRSPSANLQGRPTSQHSQHSQNSGWSQNNPSSQGGAAPVANMAPVARMAASASSPHATMPNSRPHSGAEHSPVSHHPSFSNAEYLEHIKQYPYLLNSYLRRPPHYQSPYAEGPGFTKAYLPDPITNRMTGTGYPPMLSQSPPSFASARPAPIAPRMGSSPYPSQTPHTTNPEADAARNPFTGGVPYSAQYQSPSSFQQSVSIEGSGMPGQLHDFARRINQLPALDSGSAAGSAGLASAPNAASDGFSTPLPTLANGGGTPIRPEYSPLTDAGDASPRKAEPGVLQPPLDVVTMDWRPS